MPFTLPDGDKTFVQLAPSKADEDSGIKKPKESTLCMMAKPLEKKAAEKGGALSMTSFGKLLPATTAGKHELKFEFPFGHQQRKGKQYVENACAPGPKKGDKKLTAGNCFHPLMRRSGYQGVLDIMWRFQFDPVTHILEVRKPLMATGSKKIPLEKGKPVRVLWCIKKEQEQEA